MSELKLLQVLRLVCPMCAGSVDSDTLMCSSCHDHADPGIKVVECFSCQDDAYEDTWKLLDSGDVICEECAEKYK